MLKTEDLKLVSEWDKTFPQSLLQICISPKIHLGNTLRLP